MPAPAPVRERPESAEDAAGLLAELGHAGRQALVHGGGTKLGWLAAAAPGTVEVGTERLARVLEHNAGDFTLVTQAGAKLLDLQRAVAAEGQMLALDPPLGQDEAASIGGILAAADSGPLRHRYGGPRDLVLGVTIALSDGSVARAGGKVIKNVAGYDLGKLFTGSLGALGLIAEVSLRLHPRPEATCTVRAEERSADRLAEAAAQLVALPLEAECLDVGWGPGGGELLIRFGGRTAAERARRVAGRLAELGLPGAELVEDDETIWQAQRARQRRPEGLVVKLSGLIADLGGVLRAAQATGAEVVSRAGLGLSWIALGEPAALDELRRRLPGRRLTVLDGAREAGAAAAREAAPEAAAEVMRRIKARFDPAGVLPAVVGA